MKKVIILCSVFTLSGCASLVNPNLASLVNPNIAPVPDVPESVEQAAAEPILEALEPVVEPALALAEPLKPLQPLVDAVTNTLSSEKCTSTGCRPKDEQVKNDPVFAPIEPVEPAVDVIPTGSLFQDSYANNLYSDIRAHRVGDIITVYLEESTSASKQAGTSYDKNNNYAIELGDITLPSTSENGVSVYGGGGEGSQTSSFSGDSGTDQSNSLQGSITVNVTRVLSNGNLEIRGEKWLMLNNGEEFIRIKGVIRSEDVGADNSISSTHIANSRIQYGGTGDFASTQKQGWLTSFFSQNWPL